jgi:hypothetical protein
MTTTPQTQRRDDSKLRSAFRWMFESRETGKIVVAQVPNLPLAIFLVATAGRMLFHPRHAVGTAVSVVASVSLLYWSVMEIARGVNPFRRILGGLVLAGIVIGLVSRLL